MMNKEKKCTSQLFLDRVVHVRLRHFPLSFAHFHKFSLEKPQIRDLEKGKKRKKVFRNVRVFIM